MTKIELDYDSQFENRFIQEGDFILHKDDLYYVSNVGIDSPFENAKFILVNLGNIYFTKTFDTLGDLDYYLKDRFENEYRVLNKVKITLKD